MYSISPASNRIGGPVTVHISLAGDKHIRVSWVTDDKSCLSTVEYGTSPGRYSAVSHGESTSYSYLFYSSGKIHHTVIGPLEPNTVYFYRCGGQDYMQHRWDTFGELVQPLASSRPWMVTEGNHEEESIPIIKDGFQSYNSRWKMPFEESGSSSNLYYSFEVAGAHVIMLGSFTDYDEYSEQYNWLKADLTKLDRNKTPWLLVLVHVPWYNSNHAHQGEGDEMMAVIEPLLYAAGVDIVLAGHVHAYERTKRVNNGNLDPCGAVHLTIGDGGNREGLARKYINPQPEWSVFREASFGHGELKLVNSTHAYWTWHRNDDDEPVRSDQVWITSLVSSGCLDEKRQLRKILMGP
ncbi:hypothetical protein GH714_012234 [Hevea brasiliensis]|uniref:Purple acid phosphatase n=1 Tax=Hevea brasiliensis TaxID=3981 RepID=A0A6A6KIK0_HEVBR|nr:hypothetical protein GH714_012234 [Hevea brasiliensis]